MDLPVEQRIKIWWKGRGGAESKHSSRSLRCWHPDSLLPCRSVAEPITPANSSSSTLEQLISISTTLSLGARQGRLWFLRARSAIMTSSGSCANKQRGSVTHDQPALRDVTLVRAKTGNVIKHGPCCINISRCDPSPASHTFQNGERVGFFSPFIILVTELWFIYRVGMDWQDITGVNRMRCLQEEGRGAGGCTVTATSHLDPEFPPIGATAWPRSTLQKAVSNTVN